MSEFIHYASDIAADATAFAPAPERSARADFAERLRHLLRRLPEANVIVDADRDSVTVLRLSPLGPDVTAIFSEGRFTLAIGSWQDDMETLDDMLAFARMAVEGDLRVRIDKLGSKPSQFALERRLDDGSWREESVLVLPRLRLWKRTPTTSYLQNVL